MVSSNVVKPFSINGRPLKSINQYYNKEIYAQLIDDKEGKTLVFASSREKEVNAKGTKTEVAAAVGKRIAEKAKAAGYEKVVFDRNGFVYHGRIKALADGAREGGLQF